MMAPPIQTVAWLLALAELTLALYIMILNPRQLANQLMAALFMVIGINSFATSLLMQAYHASQALIPTLLLAATLPSSLPLLVLLIPVLIKPSWLEGWRRWLWVGLAGFIVLPAIFTTIDLNFKTRLYYTGVNPQGYPGGFLTLPAYTQGLLSPFIRFIGQPFTFILLVAVLLYLAWRDRSIAVQQRRLAWVLFLVNAVAGILLFVFPILPQRGPLHLTQLGALLAGFLLATVYSLVGYQHNISIRRLQRGNLRARLTALALVVTVPLLFGVSYFIATQAERMVEAQAVQNIQSASNESAKKFHLWLQADVQALQQAAILPDIYSMEASRQKPILEEMITVHPSMALISTLDPQGNAIARSDSGSNSSFADQAWFHQVLQGIPYVIQTVADGTFEHPGLVISVPIYDPKMQIMGALMSVSDISSLSEQMSISKIGTTGFVYIFDEQNRKVISSEVASSAFPGNLGNYAPVNALRQGRRGEFIFEDGTGLAWRADLEQLENGWGVIAQQTEAEFFAPLSTIQRSVAWAGGIGLLLLMGLIWLTVRQSLRPIQTLNRAAKAIAGGDFNRVVPVETADELGTLAESFNQMTGQLKESIFDLEQRVVERTQDLDRRSRQLEAAARVSREAAAIRDVRMLLNRTTYLISHHFDYYHAGIFLIDDGREFAVLQASNSEGGQRMLAREHKLRVGQVGIVGYVASTGLPRIALDVGEDAVFFNNPDLPETRSEMALPLKVRDQVIGVLDVQSKQPAAFKDEDIEVLQVMADQIALALENVRLLEESHRVIEELSSIYGQQTLQSWRRRLGRKAIAYRYDRLEVHPTEITPLEKPVVRSQSAFIQSVDERHELVVPLRLRDQALGTLVLRRDKDQNPWSEEEKNLASEMITSVLPALEIARLLEEIQNRAQLESLTGQVSNRVQSSLDLETVVKTAVQEIGLVVNASKVQIRFTNGDPPESAAAEGNNAIHRSEHP